LSRAARAASFVTKRSCAWRADHDATGQPLWMIAKAYRWPT
jgi:hypothetical protein